MLEEFSLCIRNSKQPVDKASQINTTTTTIRLDDQPTNSLTLLSARSCSSRHRERTVPLVPGQARDAVRTAWQPRILPAAFSSAAEMCRDDRQAWRRVAASGRLGMRGGVDARQQSAVCCEWQLAAIREFVDCGRAVSCPLEVHSAPLICWH